MDLFQLAVDCWLLGTRAPKATRTKMEKGCETVYVTEREMKGRRSRVKMSYASEVVGFTVDRRRDKVQNVKLHDGGLRSLK